MSTERRAAATRANARRLFFESSSRFNFLLAHDLFRKPVSTFRDHALAPAPQCLRKTDQREVGGGMRPRERPIRGMAGGPKSPLRAAALRQGNGANGGTGAGYFRRVNFLTIPDGR